MNENLDPTGEHFSSEEMDIERALRPLEFDDFAGQDQVLDNLKVFVKAANQRGEALDHTLFHGPPGLGKTTLAHILANELGVGIKVTSGPVLDKPGDLAGLLTNLDERDVLFIDEIHRFSKSQQDSLLGAVEKGWVTLIGATTENPSFEVISALLSRCQVYILKPFTKEDLLALLERAKTEDPVISKKEVILAETEALLRLSGGDARKLLNIFELLVMSSGDRVEITNDMVMEQVQQNTVLYDKAGEQHYDIISAFIKSIRGSDPNAAVYWLARMIEGGEDVKFIARRLLILASEDIGNANPTALVIANNTFQAVTTIGFPESRIILSQCVIYLATSPKSNASYMAINKAISLVQKTGDLPVPLSIRNAPTKLMKELGYGDNYQYAHNYEDNFADAEFLPEEIKNTTIYSPGNNQREQAQKEFLKKRWKNKYGY